MGAAIPALLTDGAFGSPIVKSKPVEECLTSDRVMGWLQYTIALPRTDAIFQQCFDEVNQACDNQYYFTSPRIEKRRLEYCPFPGGVCQNQTKPFEISHMNVSAYEVGINSPSKLTLNHRLTCAPVVVENLTLPNYHPNYSWVAARTTFDRQKGNRVSWTNFSVLLSTVNGPNFLTNESFSLKVALENGPMDVTVLPRHIVPLSLSIPEYQELIHEKLRRDDGQSFLIVFRAGRSLYSSAIDDPFFAAHNEYYPPGQSTSYFLPDSDATALGCVEQYQFCIPTLSGQILCSSWGHTTNKFNELVTILSSGQAGMDQAYFAISESIVFFQELTQALSIYYYLALRNRLHNLSPLLRDQISNSRGFYSVDEPWGLEVDTWFMKAILNTIFRMRMGAKYHFANFSMYGFEPNFEKEFIQQWATCGRVLFRDGDYTNINWIGFCGTTAAILFICFISYLIERIHLCGIYLVKLLTDPYGTMIKIRSVLGRLIRYLHRNVWRKVTTFFDQLYIFWKTLSYFKMRRVRQLYGN